MQTRKFNNVAMVVRRGREDLTSLSQGEVSKKLGYKNGQFISNIERGLASVPPKIINKLAKTIKVKPALIVTAMVQDERERLESIVK